MKKENLDNMFALDLEHMVNLINMYMTAATNTDDEEEANRCIMNVMIAKEHFDEVFNTWKAII